MQVGKATGAPPCDDDDTCLEWLWRYRFSADGRLATCARCALVRPFHRLRKRKAYVCDYCGHQIHPTAGTLMTRSRSPLWAWFAAARMLAGETPPSTSQIGRDLGLSYGAARRMRGLVLGAEGLDRKLLAAMAEAGFASDEEQTKASEFLVTTREDADGNSIHSKRARGKMDKILAAACRAIASKGLSRTRIVDIAREAQVSTGIIHYYFETKQDLLLAAVQWSGERLNRVLDPKDSRSMSDFERAARLLRTLSPSSGLYGDDYLLWLEVWVRARDHPTLLPACEALSTRWNEHIATVVREGTARGSFRPICEPEEMADRIVGLANGLGFKAALGYKSMPARRAHDRLARFIAEQLQIPLDALA